MDGDFQAIRKESITAQLGKLFTNLFWLCVSPPEINSTRFWDPHEGRHEAYSAADVLAMVEDYVFCLPNGNVEAVTDERLLSERSALFNRASGVLLCCNP